MPSRTLTPREEVQREAKQTETRPQDVGADSLPFDHLSGRRFEVLCYLVCEKRKASGEQVDITQEGGDRGRDVLRTLNGVLTEIVQCKNQRERLTAPAIKRELMKVALHAWLDRGLLPAERSIPVVLTFWCPGGFTEPAASFIANWPSEWKDNSLPGLFDEVTEEYSELSGVAWSDDLARFLTDTLPSRLRLGKEDGLTISMKVRESAQVYQQFFTGFMVAPLEDIKTAVEAALRGQNWRSVSDRDNRDILDRLESFAPDKRLYFGLGYVFGVSAELLADMPSDAQRTFLSDLSRPVLAMVEVMKLVPAKAHEIVEALRPTLSFKNRSFPYVLSQILSTRALRQLGALYKTGIDLRTHHEELKIDDIWVLASRLCERVWGDAQKVLADDFVKPTSDVRLERLRRDLAQHVIAGYDEATLVKELKDDCDKNRSAITTAVATIEDYFPSDLVVIADSRTALADPKTVERMKETLTSLATHLARQTAK